MVAIEPGSGELGNRAYLRKATSLHRRPQAVKTRGGRNWRPGPRYRTRPILTDPKLESIASLSAQGTHRLVTTRAPGAADLSMRSAFSCSMPNTAVAAASAAIQLSAVTVTL